MTMIKSNQVSDSGDRVPIYLNAKFVRYFLPMSVPLSPICREMTPATYCQMEHASAVIIDMPFEDVVSLVEKG